MRTRIKTALTASALGVSLLAAPTLHAQDRGGASGSMMGPGMMSQGGMMSMMGNMMSGMMNMMMGTSDDMAGMMEQCHEMMQAMGDHDHGPARANEQWREPAPSNPSGKG
jgi:hypothetical protein